MLARISALCCNECLMQIQLVEQCCLFTQQRWIGVEICILGTYIHPSKLKKQQQFALQSESTDVDVLDAVSSDFAVADTMH